MRETLVGAATATRDEAWTGSGQIKAMGATCGPPRPKLLEVVAQGQMGRPATGTRRLKFNSLEERRQHGAR